MKRKQSTEPDLYVVNRKIIQYDEVFKTTFCNQKMQSILKKTVEIILFL